MDRKGKAPHQTAKAPHAGNVPKTADANKGAKRPREEYVPDTRTARERKPHYEAVLDAKLKWEEIRLHKTPSERKEFLIDQVLTRFKGKIAELAIKPDASRVIQACFKFGSPTQRDNILNAELKTQALSLMRNAYGTWVIHKVLKYGTKEHREVVFNQLYGKVMKIITKKDGAKVLDFAYEIATPTQKQYLIQEFYGAEYAVRKSTEKITLDKVLSEPGKRTVVLPELAKVAKKISAKGLVNYIIAQKLLADFMRVGNHSDVQEVIENIRDSLIHIIHTKDGAKIGVYAIAYGSAKDRKSILKSFKTFVKKIAEDSYGHMVLCRVVDTVDDTELINSTLLKELRSEGIPALCQHVYARKVLLNILSPHDTKYFAADQLDLLKPAMVPAPKVMPIRIEGVLPEHFPMAADSDSETESESEDKEVEPAAANDKKQKMVAKKGKDEDSDDSDDEEGEEEEEMTGPQRKRAKRGGGAPRISNKPRVPVVHEEIDMSKKFICTSKKAMDVRRRELLSYLKGDLVKLLTDNTHELLAGQHSTDVVFEVIRSLPDICPTGEDSGVAAAIAHAVKSNPDLLTQQISSRLIRRIIDFEANPSFPKLSISNDEESTTATAASTSAAAEVAAAAAAAGPQRQAASPLVSTALLAALDVQLIDLVAKRGAGFIASALVKSKHTKPKALEILKPALKVFEASADKGCKLLATVIKEQSPAPVAPAPAAKQVKPAVAPAPAAKATTAAAATAKSVAPTTPAKQAATTVAATTTTPAKAATPAKQAAKQTPAKTTTPGKGKKNTPLKTPRTPK